MSNFGSRSTLEGLPKSFLDSLKTLFGILDENKTGYISFSDISSAWEKDPVEGLPPGVIEALKKVTPPNGLLSFERFVAGLKIALLRKQADSQPVRSTNTINNQHSSKPDLLADTQYDNYSRQRLHSQGNQNVGPRTKSLPHLGWDSEKDQALGQIIRPEPQYAWKQPMKADRTDMKKEYHMDDGRGTWNSDQKFVSRRPGDGRSSIATASALPNYGQFDADDKGKSPSKRREPRRHTLSSGIDYHMIKHMKLLEQEKDILLQGYQAVQQATDWYQNQLADVEQKQKYIGQTTSHGDYSVEAHQERINFQTARVLEVNQQLRALIDSSQKGFPFHMHLAVSQSTMQRNDTEKDNVIAMLKAQNKMLTKEVGSKSDNISQLEKEKAQLIRELFQAHNRQSYGNSSYDDTTFI